MMGQRQSLGDFVPGLLRGGRAGWSLPLFLAPAIAAVLVLRLLPSAQAVLDSLRLPDGGFGLGNFTFLFGDAGFQNSLKVTLLFALLVNPLQIGLALAIAVLLNNKVPLIGLWRTALLLPVAIPQSISAIIWSVIFRPDGPLNAVLATLALPEQRFLTSVDQALFCIIVMVSWIGVGYWMIFLVAGLKDIPASLYEAATIDGASTWQQFRYVTLPQLRRPLTFVLVADTVANFLIFAPVQILTGGGPEGSTDLIMNNLYSRAFITNDAGGAAAQTLILVAIVVTIVSVQFRLMLPKEGQA
jgi:multiple sugar transport system permease protein